MKPKFLTTKYPAMIASFFLFCSLFIENPKGYFTLLRLVVSTTATFMAFELPIHRSEGLKALLVLLVLLYNPLFPVYLEKDQWNVINVLSAGLLLYSYYSLSKSSSSKADSNFIISKPNSQNEIPTTNQDPVPEIQGALSKSQKEFDLKRKLISTTGIKRIRTIYSLEQSPLSEASRISPSVTSSVFTSLEAKFKRTLELSTESINRGSSDTIKLGILGDLFPNLFSQAELDVWAKYEGNQGGGRTNIFFLNGSQKESLLSLSCNIENLEGFIEAFFLVFELPKYGLFWHGLYDHDYYFLLRLKELYNHPLILSFSRDDKRFLKLRNRPPGLRLTNATSGYRIHMNSVKTETSF